MEHEVKVKVSFHFLSFLSPFYVELMEVKRHFKIGTRGLRVNIFIWIILAYVLISPKDMKE